MAQRQQQLLQRRWQLKHRQLGLEQQRRPQPVRLQPVLEQQRQA